MGSKDNGIFPEKQMRQPHFPPRGRFAKPSPENSSVSDDPFGKASSGSRPVPESEYKKAGSKTSAFWQAHDVKPGVASERIATAWKTPAARERTPIHEGPS
jgi:hypothetical protein